MSDMMNCGHFTEHYYHVRDTEGRDEEGCLECNRILRAVGSRQPSEPHSQPTGRAVQGNFLADWGMVVVTDRNAIISNEKWAELKAWIDSIPIPPPKPE